MTGGFVIAIDGPAASGKGTLGRLIAERSKEADVYALAYEPRKGERIEGKLGIVIDTIKENGIIFVD